MLKIDDYLLGNMFKISIAHVMMKISEQNHENCILTEASMTMCSLATLMGTISEMVIVSIPKNVDLKII